VEVVGHGYYMIVPHVVAMAISPTIGMVVPPITIMAIPLGYGSKSELPLRQGVGNFLTIVMEECQPLY
jgi:hypothetical protein